MAVVEPAAPVSGSAAERALIADLTELCRSQLAGYKCPRSWEVAERLPRNEAGKLAKRLLRDPYWSNTSRSI